MCVQRYHNTEKYNPTGLSITYFAVGFRKSDILLYTTHRRWSLFETDTRSAGKDFCHLQNLWWFRTKCRSVQNAIWKQNLFSYKIRDNMSSHLRVLDSGWFWKAGLLANKKQHVTRRKKKNTHTQVAREKILSKWNGPSLTPWFSQCHAIVSPLPSFAKICIVEYFWPVSWRFCRSFNFMRSTSEDTSA